MCEGNYYLLGIIFFIIFILLEINNLTMKFKQMKRLTFSYFLICLFICLIESGQKTPKGSNMTNREMASKKTLMESCHREFFQVYDEFFLRKLDSEVSGHFKEIGTQIEARRDELKKEVDAISNNMNRKTRKHGKLLMERYETSLKSYKFKISRIK